MNRCSVAAKRANTDGILTYNIINNGFTGIESSLNCYRSAICTQKMWKSPILFVHSNFSSLSLPPVYARLTLRPISPRVRVWFRITPVRAVNLASLTTVEQTISVNRILCHFSQRSLSVEELSSASRTSCEVDETG